MKYFSVVLFFAFVATTLSLPYGGGGISESHSAAQASSGSVGGNLGFQPGFLGFPVPNVGLSGSRSESSASSQSGSFGGVPGFGGFSGSQSHASAGSGSGTGFPGGYGGY